MEKEGVETGDNGEQEVLQETRDRRCCRRCCRRDDMEGKPMKR